jgi:hypothetical protein
MGVWPATQLQVNPLSRIGSFQKRSKLPPWRKFLPPRGGGETKLFLIIVNVLGHPKGVGGLTSNFLRGAGGMDVFWNDPLHPDAPYFIILICLTPDDFTRQGESTGA